MYKIIIIILLSIYLGGCSKGILPVPQTVMPERSNKTFSPESYGEYPNNYQKILKKFLQEKIINHRDAMVDFINVPSQISINQLGNEFTGYRICLSVNAKNRKSVYTGYKTHLFVINNGKVVLHLFDSGLLKIPFSLCVDRDESKAIYLDDIPDTEITIDEMDEKITIDKMDKIDPLKEKINKHKMDDIYILCKLNNVERTFVFNEYKTSLSESIGIDEVEFDNIKFSTTHIFGIRSNEEILINRISGSVTSTKSKTSIDTGSCELLNSKKF